MGIRGDRPSDGQPPLIELLPLERSRTVAPAKSAPQPPTDRGRAPRRRTVVIGVVLALGVFVAVSVIANGGDDGDDDIGAPPSTESAVATSHVPTSIPIHSAVLSGSVPTTALLPTSTGRVGSAPARITGPSGYRWVSFTQNSMRIVDFDDIRVDEYAVQVRNAGGAQSPMVFADRVLYTTYDVAAAPQVPSVWSQSFDQAPPKLVVDRATIVTVSSTTTRLWIRPVDGMTDESYEMVEIERDGRRSATISVPAGLRVVGAHADGLWLYGSGVVFTISRSGAIRPIANGTTIDSSAAGVLFDDCAIAGPCTTRFVNNLSQTSIVGPSSELLRASAREPSDSMLSPDGRWLILADGLLDRRSNQRHPHSYGVFGWRWSPDGEWLFLSTAAEGVAWNLRDMERVGLGFREPLAGVVAR